LRKRQIIQKNIKVLIVVMSGRFWAMARLPITDQIADARLAIL
jgi:hypothetical protein